MSREDVDALLYTARLRLARVLADVVDARAEIAVSACLLGGWGLVTVAITQLLPHAPVWPLSAGLFFLSLTGWKLIGQTAWFGLYALYKEEKAAEDRAARGGGRG